MSPPSPGFGTLSAVPLAEPGDDEAGDEGLLSGPPLMVIESTPDHVIGTLENVSFHVWRHRTLAAAVPAVIEAFARARGQGGGRFANVGIVEANAPLPESEVRSQLARLMRDAGEEIVASSMTFEGTGFRAAAVRSAVMGLSLMARQPYPHRIFASVGEATDWLVSQMRRRQAPSPPSSTIRRAIRRLRATPAR